jgi:hypothetical protein
MTENSEICRINADGTTTYHWDNIETEAQRWQPGCDDISVCVSKLLLPLRPNRCAVCGRTFEIGQQFFNYGHGEVVHIACRFRGEKEKNT